MKIDVTPISTMYMIESQNNMNKTERYDTTDPNA
jgi:hypothetical protein